MAEALSGWNGKYACGADNHDTVKDADDVATFETLFRWVPLLPPMNHRCSLQPLDKWQLQTGCSSAALPVSVPAPTVVAAPEPVVAPVATVLTMALEEFYQRHSHCEDFGYETNWLMLHCTKQQGNLCCEQIRVAK